MGRSAKKLRTRKFGSIASVIAVSAATVGSFGVAAATSSPAARPLSLGHWASPIHLTAKQILRLSRNQNDRVIVVLKDQFSGLDSRMSEMSARTAAVHSDQARVLTQLALVHAEHVHSYHFINAISATVSRAEARWLRGNPEVREVVPDAMVKMQDADVAKPSDPTPVASGQATIPNTEPNICPAAGKKPLVEPEALQLMHVGSAHPTINSQFINGSGVKIAVFPDGVDTTIPDFQRNGHSVVGDYEDFTGEGIDAPTGGGEAFGDVSSIAAQGTQVYNLQNEVNPAYPIDQSCKIRVKGVAPGATVDVMKVFGEADESFDSVLLQGMDYAVTTDKVNILSQSFGGNSIPQPATDPVSIFDREAAAMGVLVVVSSGDAGTSNTEGSPATESNSPGIIAAGASTAFRDNADVGYYAGPAYGDKGWESDNVASLSSSGTSEYGPNTVDVLAPGDSGWADCSFNIKIYSECKNAFGSKAKPKPPIELFGGTSESCPLTAGTAALVIQAYEATHNGAAPSPSLIKQIITSSAQPLKGVPADEQGSGLVDSGAAVQLAETVAGSGVTPTTAGPTLLLSKNRISTVGQPGAREASSVTVTNETAASQTVTPTLTTLSKPTLIASGKPSYNNKNTSLATYPSPVDGKSRSYLFEPITVPSGTDRLVVRESWSQKGAQAGSFLNESLVDPDGRIVNSSDSQGATGFAEIEAREPAAGVWGVAFYSGHAGYDGPIVYSAYAQHEVSFADGPAVTLASGASASVPVKYSLPSSPGDVSAELSFVSSGLAEAPQLAIVTRAKIPVTAKKAGTFSGNLTGGNGRMEFYQQELPYEFQVPKGTKEINVNLKFAGDGTEVFADLVDPNNQPVDVQSTDLIGIKNGSDTPLKTAHLTWLKPVAGDWHLDLADVGLDESEVTSIPFSGSVNFSTYKVKTKGIPNSTKRILKAKKKLKATIVVTNHGNSPEQFFLDPRTTSSSPQLLQPLTDPTGALPLTATEDNPLGFSAFLLPPFSKRVAMVSVTSVPVYLEAFGVNPNVDGGGGDDGISPLSTATSKGDEASVLFSSKELASTGYGCAPQQPGPFTTTAAPTGTYACAAAGEMNTFNSAIKTPVPDVWTANKPSGITIEPGKSKTLTIYFDPTKKGTVKGFIAVESLNALTFGTNVLSEIPYSYKVK